MSVSAFKRSLHNNKRPSSDNESDTSDLKKEAERTAHQKSRDKLAQTYEDLRVTLYNNQQSMSRLIKKSCASNLWEMTFADLNMLTADRIEELKKREKSLRKRLEQAVLASDVRGEAPKIATNYMWKANSDWLKKRGGVDIISKIKDDENHLPTFDEFFVDNS